MAVYYDNVPLSHQTMKSLDDIQNIVDSKLNYIQANGGIPLGNDCTNSTMDTIMNMYPQQQTYCYDPGNGYGYYQYPQQDIYNSGYYQQQPQFGYQQQPQQQFGNGMYYTNQSPINNGAMMYNTWQQYGYEQQRNAYYDEDLASLPYITSQDYYYDSMDWDARKILPVSDDDSDGKAEQDIYQMFLDRRYRTIKGEYNPCSNSMDKWYIDELQRHGWDNIYGINPNMFDNGDDYHEYIAALDEQNYEQSKFWVDLKVNAHKVGNNLSSEDHQFRERMESKYLFVTHKEMKEKIDEISLRKKRIRQYKEPLYTPEQGFLTKTKMVVSKVRVNEDGTEEVVFKSNDDKIVDENGYYYVPNTAKNKHQYEPKSISEEEYQHRQNCLIAQAYMNVTNLLGKFSDMSLEEWQNGGYQEYYSILYNKEYQECRRMLYNRIHDIDAEAYSKNISQTTSCLYSKRKDKNFFADNDLWILVKCLNITNADEEELDNNLTMREVFNHEYQEMKRRFLYKFYTNTKADVSIKGSLKDKYNQESSYDITEVNEEVAAEYLRLNYQDKDYRYYQKKLIPMSVAIQNVKKRHGMSLSDKLIGHEIFSCKENKEPKQEQVTQTVETEPQTGFSIFSKVTSPPTRSAINGDDILDKIEQEESAESTYQSLKQEGLEEISFESLDNYCLLDNDGNIIVDKDVNIMDSFGYGGGSA